MSMSLFCLEFNDLMQKYGLDGKNYKKVLIIVPKTYF